MCMSTGKEPQKESKGEGWKCSNKKKKKKRTRTWKRKKSTTTTTTTYKQTNKQTNKQANKQTSKQTNKQTSKQTNRAQQRKNEFGDATRRVLGLGLSTKTLHCKAKRKASCRATEEGRRATTTTATARRRRQRRENVCAWVCVRRRDYAISCVLFYTLLYLEGIDI